MSVNVLWLRRDLRRLDHPALAAAAASGSVAPVFVLDDVLWEGAGQARRWWLAATLSSLHDAYDGALRVLRGRPEQVVPAVAAQVGARQVHVTAETFPYGRRRDAAVAQALSAAGVEWVETGSPYAVGPGTVKTQAGTPYSVFTPFARRWREEGWARPCPSVDATWCTGWDAPQGAQDVAPASWLNGVNPPPEPVAEPGEDAAHRRWQQFVSEDLDEYGEARDRPAEDATSLMSPYLKLGVMHPRTLLAGVADAGGRSVGAEKYVTEVAWREFYADVTWHQPASLRRDLTDALAGMPYDDPDDPAVAELIDAWKQGRTGYPIVDAGMRQLLATGWMHNRVRMIVASFLTKDLHVWWPVGARHFMEHLIDGDVASNSHGWQWTAGTGTDASPYFRVFNPTSQGQRWDPQGEYVRRWVPELAHIQGKAVHEPWKALDGGAHGYPDPIVDHAEARAEALHRYDVARNR